MEAMEAMEVIAAIASVAPGLCLGALSKVPIEIYKFLIEVPFAMEKSPCPFKYEVSSLECSILNVVLNFAFTCISYRGRMLLLTTTCFWKGYS